MSKGFPSVILGRRSKNLDPFEDMRRNHLMIKSGTKVLQKLATSNIERSEKSTISSSIPNSNSLIEAPQIISSSRAIVVDARTLQTFEGDAAGTSFIDTVLNFFKICGRRGLLPRFLATPHASNNAGKHSSRSISVEARACTLDILINEGGINSRCEIWESPSTR